MENIKLDIWDYKLIRALKHNKNVYNEAKRIWAERCSIKLGEVDLAYINNRLLEIAFCLGLVKSDFVLTLSSSRNWYYLNNDYFLSEKELDFNLILFSRLDSLFSLTEINKIPGYEDFIKKQA